MSRGIDSTLLAAISDPTGFHPVALIKSVWPDGTVYVHSNVGSISWDSQTWLGIGDIADVEVPQEAGGIVPQSATLVIRGTLDAVLTYADPDARNGEVSMWIGATTTPGGTTLIGEPFLAFRGYLDSSDVSLDFAAGDFFLSASAVTGPAARESATVVHSDEDQKARHSGDTFFERAAAAAKWRSIPIRFPE